MGGRNVGEGPGCLPERMSMTVDLRCVALIERYHDLGLGVVDASVVAVAERLGALTSDADASLLDDDRRSPRVLRSHVI